MYASLRRLTIIALLHAGAAGRTAGAQGSSPKPASTPAPSPATGRISGRVVDGNSGLPLPGVQLLMPDHPGGAETDLDGRYALERIPAGRYSVRARRLGFQAKQFDSVAVNGGQTTVVNFTLSTAAVALSTVKVSTERVDQAASATSLLAMQQRAASASDGISAEQIRRTPDSDAGQAATRVSGVSVVDDKYVIVRGLSERYSNTLLNGVEVSSPEPTKKIVPMDIFPASLLESIVVSKSATPDKPGDFSGGSVEIRTKEFPDARLMQLSITQGYNSEATFSSLAAPHWSGLDYLGFPGARRTPPVVPADSAFANPFAVERFAEAIRSDWTPRQRRTLPNLGLGVTLGDQHLTSRGPIGYVFSLTYAMKTEHQGDRFVQFFTDPNSDPIRGFVYQDFQNSVDWGGVGNLSWRVGQGSKLGWKNLYTRSAQEVYRTNDGFNTDRNGAVRAYQFQYVDQDLLQSQITGDHLVGFLGSAFALSRFEWKATLSRASRDEPDNRTATYLRAPNGDFAIGSNSDVWFRDLIDRQYAGQVDWTLPITAFGIRDFTFKTGGLARRKQREFHSSLFSFNPKRSTEIPNDLVTLPPSLLFTPENIGSFLQLDVPGSVAQPYDADDNLNAAYAMIDASVIPRVRIVAGARYEMWQLDLFDGGRARFEAGDTTARLTRRNNDLLWSVNATASITDRMNLRLAVFRSVTRPDTRELSREANTKEPGSCPEVGNPNLMRALVLNGDVRWEWYPDPGEVIAVSGFYKNFDQPIIRAVNGDNNCTFTYENAVSARNYGAEVDVRRTLSRLPGPFSRLGIGLNVTYVQSRITIDPRFGVYKSDLTLEGQSPWLTNLNMSYASSSNRFAATMLFNYFADRIVRYGFRSGGGPNATQGPNIVERGRGTLDLKVQQALSHRLTASLSGRNLTNVRTDLFQQTARGETSTGISRPGTTLQLGVTYAR